MKNLIRNMCYKYLPRKWFDEGIEDIVDEISFKIDGLDEPEKHIKACIDYILDMGDGDPIGIDLLINEHDDCNIWNYME